MVPYLNHVEHLQDELRRLDRLLEGAVARFRSRRAKDQPDQFRGLYITDQDIDLLQSAGVRTEPLPGSHAIQESLKFRKQIEDRVAAGDPAKIGLRLAHLASLFALSAFEYDVVLLALAPEIDLRYQRLYAYLQDDVTRKRPSVELALQLFCFTLEERLGARQAFAEKSTLLTHGLLTLHEDPADRPMPLLGRLLKLDDRVVEFLMGSDRADPRLLTPVQAVRWVRARATLDQLVLACPVKESLQHFIRLVNEGHASRCLLHGPVGAGRKVAAESICHALDCPLLVVDLPTLLLSDTPAAILLRLAFREAKLYRAALYLDGWQELLADEPCRAAILTVAEAEMDRMPGILFLGNKSAWQPTQANRQRFFVIEVAVPGDQQRHRLWQSCLNHGSDLDAGVKTEYLASAFRFTPGQICRAVAMARTRASYRQGSSCLTQDDLLAGCRAEAAQCLNSFARNMRPQRSWADLVLPKDTLDQLHEFCQQARRRVLVYDRWGFGRKLSLGKGLIALFAGPSGTGKTLSAEILAHELGLDMYRIDLSCVVSKYIGETEKNLSRVFAEAQESNAILFFDEADALFGKRSEVKDAHDRYANIEINYLLQRVEEFEGVIILASNFSKNIDSAFLRRLHFAVEFPFPDEEHRLQIWRGIFPREAPLAEDLDFEFLARKFKMAGGSIKNVALAAAFQAAEDGEIIRMKHLIAAVKREYQKLGKVCEKADFERYYEQVRA